MHRISPRAAPARILDLATAVPMLRRAPGSMLRKPAEDLLGLTGMNQFLEQLQPQDDSSTIFQRALDLMGLRYRIAHGGCDAIPATGPVVVVANHPFGGADALVLSHLLATRRTDMKMLANHMIGRIEAVRPWLIPVDPFGTGSSRPQNIGPMKQAIAHLRGGGCLGVFPAGEVSSFSSRRGVVADKSWSRHVAALVRKTGATVVPVCFAGQNSLIFQAAGMMHPLLRTAMLPREFLRCRGKEILLKIGTAIPAGNWPSDMKDDELVDALRMRVELLAGHQRAKPRQRQWKRFLPGARAAGPILPEPLPPPSCPALIAAEIGALPADSLLASQGGLEVRLARAEEIPHALKEIGRLRELTFRRVGEGTGRSRDLDGFDNHYRHLLLWNPAAREIAGAYRIGLSDELAAHAGPAGFYTHTLFKFRETFLRQLGPCLELGRSFVIPSYQRKPHSLFLLWKGIGRFVASHPRYRRLFGPVSISSEYSMVSQSLMVEFLRRHHARPEMASLVRPRNPFQASQQLRRQHGEIAAGLGSIEDVSVLVSGLEGDGKGVPVLLRQYVKLNAVLLKFNVDPEFSNTLDGLVVVDLLAADPKLMARYMGDDGWESFRRWHGSGCAR